MYNASTENLIYMYCKVLVALAVYTEAQFKNKEQGNLKK